MTLHDVIAWVKLSSPPSAKWSTLGDESTLRTLHSCAVLGITGSAALCLAGTIVHRQFSIPFLMTPLLLIVAGGVLAPIATYLIAPNTGAPSSSRADPADPAIELYGRSAMSNAVLRKVCEKPNIDAVYRTVFPRGVLDSLFGLQIISMVIGVSVLNASAPLISIVLIAETVAGLFPWIVTFKRYRLGSGTLLVEHVCQWKPRVVQTVRLRDARVRADLDGGYLFVSEKGASICVDLATLLRPTNFVAQLVRESVSARTDGRAGSSGSSGNSRTGS